MEAIETMEDSEIVDLYWERSESAIDETAKKYSRYCHRISFNILKNKKTMKMPKNVSTIHISGHGTQCRQTAPAFYLLFWGR